MVLPAVILVLALCLSALQLCQRQMRVQGAAAVAARVLARGDAASAPRLVASLVPGASLAVIDRGSLVCARVSATARAPTGLVSIALAATSCSPASIP
ncbi:MAG: hypothetical protein H7146_09360 [Burkholderiaceae bacterium]|nr:hypothetical protein [Microbacteriaceae bacterium]